MLHATAASPPLKRPDTHCTRGWVDLGVDMDGSGKSRLQRSSKSEPSNPPPVAIPAAPSYSRTKKLSFLYSVLPSREREWVIHMLPKPAEGLLVSPRNLRHTFYFQIRWFVTLIHSKESKPSATTYTIAKFRVQNNELMFASHPWSVYERFRELHLFNMSNHVFAVTYLKHFKFVIIHCVCWRSVSVCFTEMENSSRSVNQHWTE